MNAAAFDKDFLWRFRARLVRVIDADTLVVEVDAGFGGRHEADLRLEGIDAPEARTPEGERATAALRRLLAEGTGAWPLRVATTQLKTKVGEQTTFARYVGRVWLARWDGGLEDVNAWLVATGFARPAEKGRDEP